MWAQLKGPGRVHTGAFVFFSSSLFFEFSSFLPTLLLIPHYRRYFSMIPHTALMME
jgi:hypothetical protein